MGLVSLSDESPAGTRGAHMSNGNDWDVQPKSPDQPDGGDDDPYRAPEADDLGGDSPGGGGEGGDDMDPLEGWGKGRYDFNELIDNTKLVFDRIKGPILYALIAILGVNLLTTWLQAGLKIVGAATGAELLTTLAAIPMTLVVLIASLVIGPLQIAMLGPVRERVLEGRSFQGFWDVIQRGFDRWVQVLLGGSSSSSVSSSRRHVVSCPLFPSSF